MSDWRDVSLIDDNLKGGLCLRLATHFARIVKSSLFRGKLRPSSMKINLNA